MYTIIGTKGCSRCELVTMLLKNNNIPYEYKKIEELTPEQKNNYLRIASERGINSFPLIIKDEEIYDIKEVLDVH